RRRSSPPGTASGRAPPTSRARMCPTHQFAKTFPPRPPHVNLADLRSLHPPQLGLDHPLPQRLLTHFNRVVLAQVLRRQRRTEVAVLGSHQLDRPLPHLSPIFRFDGRFRRPCTTARSPFCFSFR